MHGGFGGKLFPLPRHRCHVFRETPQLFRVLFKPSVILGQLLQRPVQRRNICGGQLYIRLPISVGHGRLLKFPHQPVRKAVGILRAGNGRYALWRRDQRLLKLLQILHIAVQQILAQPVHLPVAQHDAARAVKKAYGGGQPVKALLDGVKPEASQLMHPPAPLSLCGSATGRPPAAPSPPGRRSPTDRRRTPPIDPSRCRKRR